MSAVEVLILILVGSSAVYGCVLAWLFARKGLGGKPLQERLDRLEAEVARLAVADRDAYVNEEVRSLDERVDFLERLLATRSKDRSLPRDDNG